MALIGKTTNVSLNTSADQLHDEVWKATYKVFKDGGDWYLQIDTYGKANRQFADQPSQKIQIEWQKLLLLLKSSIKEMRQQGMDVQSIENVKEFCFSIEE